MKYLSIAILSLSISVSYAQDLTGQDRNLKVREEIFGTLSNEAVKAPECGFPIQLDLLEARDKLKSKEAAFSKWVKEAKTLEDLGNRVKEELTQFKALTSDLNNELTRTLNVIKQVDVSGTAGAPHLGSYCATSELLLIAKNFNSTMGKMTLLNQSFKSVPYEYLRGLNEEEMNHALDLRDTVYEAKTNLERFQSSLQRAFKNDVNFISYLRTKRFINRSNFKEYKRHFKKMKSISRGQLRVFEKEMGQLSKQERKQFSEILKSQKSAYKDLGNMHEARRRKVINTLVIMSNLTWGLTNTLVGASVIAVGAIAAPFSPILDMPRFEKSDSGKKIAVDVDNLFIFPSNVSFGLFQLKSNMEGVDEHEGGHAVQSAILGPLYLPVVFGDYAVEGSISDNIIEENADHNGDKIPGRLTLEELRNTYYY